MNSKRKIALSITTIMSFALLFAFQNCGKAMSSNSDSVDGGASSTADGGSSSSADPKGAGGASPSSLAGAADLSPPADIPAMTLVNPRQKKGYDLFYRLVVGFVDQNGDPIIPGPNTELLVLQSVNGVVMASTAFKPYEIALGTAKFYLRIPDLLCNFGEGCVTTFQISNSQAAVAGFTWAGYEQLPVPQ